MCHYVTIWGWVMRYSIFYHRIKNEFGDFLSAGIFVEDENGKEIKRIFDVSTDFDAIKKFVNSLNENNVSPEHLECLLEDYYAEHY